MQAFKKQLKQLKSAHDLVNPDHVWVAENKKRLMLQIGNMVGDTREKNFLYAFRQLVKIFVPSRALRILRPIFTGSMVLLLAIAGWAASVSASFNSLPGDVLWNVKVAAEKTQIAFSTTKEEKIKKQLEYAERRVEEVKIVFENNNEKSTDKHRSAAKKELEKVKESVRDTVKSADEAVRDTVKSDPTKAVQLALSIENKAGNISAGLDELKEVADKTGDKELVEQVVQTVKETNESAYIPVQSLLEASKQPEVVENQKIQDEVKHLVSEKLQGVLDDTEKVKQKAQQGTDENAAGKTPSTTSTAPTGVPTNTASSVIKSLLDSQNVAKDKRAGVPVSPELLNQVNEKTREVEKSAQEVRGLIEEGKLNEAVDRIKSLDQITNDAEAILIAKPDTTEVSVPQPTASTTVQDANIQDNTNIRESTLRDEISDTTR